MIKLFCPLYKLPLCPAQRPVFPQQSECNCKVNIKIKPVRYFLLHFTRFMFIWEACFYCLPVWLEEEKLSLLSLWVRVITWYRCFVCLRVTIVNLIKCKRGCLLNIDQSNGGMWPVSDCVIACRYDLHLIHDTLTDATLVYPLATVHFSSTSSGMTHSCWREKAGEHRDELSHRFTGNRQPELICPPHLK